MDVKTEIYKLKEKLSSNREEKVEASLQRLRKLPVDFDILLETGIGKAVNKLRSHEKFGKTAQELVAKWKKNAAQGAEINGIDYKEKEKIHSGHNKRDKPHSNTSNHSKNNEQSEKIKKSEKNAKNQRLGKNTLDDFSPNQGSFEEILGACDKKSKPKSAPAATTENNQKNNNERRNSFEDVDWSKLLPKTAPEYRPQPTLPEINYESARKRNLSTDDEIVDANLFSSKKDKNKVFSGRRQIFLAKIPSLFESCVRVLCDNIEGLGYTGGVPYDILKPVLERATPEQLFRLEDLNPYLVEDTDGLWETLCKKDFRNPEREELESWREVYERLLEEREQKLQQVKSAISAKKTVYLPVRQAKLAMAKAPREVRRQQIKYGTGRSVIPTAEEVVASRRNVVSNPEDRSKIICRPSSAQYESDTLAKRKKPAVAPLMAKTLKMLKNARK